MKIKKIVSGIILLCLLLSCSSTFRNVEFEWMDYKQWYESMTGYSQAEQFAEKLAHLNGNSFFLGGPAYYCIWTYRTIGNKCYLIVYKYSGHEIVFYRIFNYSNTTEWLTDFNKDKNVISLYIFRNFGVLDDYPLFYNYFVNENPIRDNLGMAYDAFIENDSIENEFLHTLRRDIIKYGLFNKEGYKPYD